MTSLAMRTEAPGSFSAGDLTYQKAGFDDDREIRELLRSNDMDSWARMSIEREPSFFDGENLMGQSSAIITRESSPPHQVVGMYAMSEQMAYLNGNPTNMAYMGALRVNPEYRHKLRILKNGFTSAQALSGIDTLTVFTSVASENHAARRLLEANLKGMPHYTPVGDLDSMAFSTRRGKPGKLLQPAVPADISALVEFFNSAAASYQFAPVLTRQWLTDLPGSCGLQLGDFWLLKDGPVIRGCIAIWDQRSFKQIVARGYRFPLKLIRRGYNLYAGMFGRLALPRPGTQLEQVFLSFFALDEAASDTAAAVIREALMIARLKGASVGTLGLSVKNPLCNQLQDKLHASIYRTRIETIHWPDSAVPVLDGRPPQPEVSLL
jgi:hypothetical protein